MHVCWTRYSGHINPMYMYMSKRIILTFVGLNSFIGAVMLISSSHSCVTLTAYLYSLPFHLGSCLDGTSGPS